MGNQADTGDLISLGKSGVRVTSLGLGAWQWGDRIFWNYGSGYSDADIRAVFDISLAAGINFIDTAEAYGGGKSERLLGQYLSETMKPVVVATKFWPYPWRLRKESLQRALRASLERLGIQTVDLYQIHVPFSLIPIDTWASGLAEVVSKGMARAAGVSNYNAGQMRLAYDVLMKQGFPLASNQVEYSLLNRSIEGNEIMALCRQLGVTVIAYSPLAKGVLSGKYTPEHPLPGIRGRLYRQAYLQKVQPLLQLMREIGHAHGSKTPSQVALNWVICKGALPIPGAKNARQAQENAGALGWRLTDDDVAMLDEASQKVA
jgi:aryl-alcohol dehydrogenase-like predicted oxidoreductase